MTTIDAALGATTGLLATGILVNTSSKVINPNAFKPKPYHHKHQHHHKLKLQKHKGGKMKW